MSPENKNATTYAEISIPQLRAAINGRVIAPDDAGYDKARTVFYGGIDRRPAAIVRVANAKDIAYAETTIANHQAKNEKKMIYPKQPAAK